MRLFVSMLLLIVAGQSWAIEKCKSLKMTGAQNWQPISFYQDNDHVGVIPDVLTEAFGLMDISVAAAAKTPFARSMKEVESGHSSVLAGVYFTEERNEKFRYTQAIATDTIRIFVNKNQAFSVERLSDLIGKQGLTPFGGSYGDRFDTYAKEHLSIMAYQDFSTAMTMLSRERADYLILAELDGRIRINASEWRDEIDMLDFVIAENPIYAMVSRNLPCELDITALNQSIQSLRENGRIDELLNFYLR